MRTTPIRTTRPATRGWPVPAEVTVHDLPVTGELPAALSGRYVRIGPNQVGRASCRERVSYHV